MQTLPIRLYGTAAGTGDASDLANIIIPRAGRIAGINAVFLPEESQTGDDQWNMQVSMVSVAQFTQNDVQNVLLDMAGAAMHHGSPTSGQVSSFSQFVQLNVLVAAGIKVYLHVNAMTISDIFIANIYLEI